MTSTFAAKRDARLELGPVWRLPADQSHALYDVLGLSAKTSGAGSAVPRQKEGRMRGWTPKDVTALQLRRAQQPLSKYRSRKTTIDNITFDSAKEAKRYQELKALQHVGQIAALQLQVPLELHAPSGEVIGRYLADFAYTSAGRAIFEDVKGFKTPLYRWKKKHAEAEYGIQIHEV